MMNRNQKLAVLRLFNKALLEEKPCGDYYINELLKMGVVCNPYTDIEVVLEYVSKKKLNPNVTFYKTIEDVTGKIRLELLIDQILHYQSTYGTNFQGKPFIVHDTPIDLSQTIIIDVISEKEGMHSQLLTLEKILTQAGFTITKSKDCILSKDMILKCLYNNIPIEVKAGTQGSMQSLWWFMKEKGINKGVRTSLENFSHYENIEVYPVYAISNLLK